MRFLCDMGISLKVAEWLREQGHECKHLRDEHLERLPDPDIFEKGITEQRVALAFDLDFGEIVAFAGDHVTSVIIFRIRNTRAAHVIERLSAALDQANDALRRGAVVVVEESRIRVRLLPFERPQ